MNQQQKNYFIKRINEIKSFKIMEAEKTYSEPNMMVLRKQALNDGTLSIKKKTDLDKIIKGMFKEKSQYIYNGNIPHNMGNVLISELLDGVDKFSKEVESLSSGIMEKKRKCTERIASGASQVTDTIMFGKESEALAKLAEFENTNYLK